MMRPSRCLASTPHPASHSRHVVAYQYGTPGSTSFGATRYGIRRSACRVPQPVAAPATPRPSSFRKSRRGKTTDSDMRPLVVTRHAVERGRELRVVDVLAVAADAPAHLERGVLVD